MIFIVDGLVVTYGVHRALLTIAADVLVHYTNYCTQEIEYSMVIVALCA